MSTKDQLETLARYFNLTRQVGHTTAMLEGAKNVDCMVVAHNQQWADELKHMGARDAISLWSLKHRLMGIEAPLLLDNAAMFEICSGALAEINALEQRIAKMKQAAQAIANS